MDTNKIREALEKEIGHMQSRHDDSVGPLREQLRDRIDNLKEALAELDKAPKVLTDEGIERVSKEIALPHAVGVAREAMRYARDNYGIGAPAAGLTEAEAMEVVTLAYKDGLSGERGGVERYRDRIRMILAGRKETPAAGLTVLCGCGDVIRPDTDAICGNCAAKPNAAGLTENEVMDIVLPYLRGEKAWSQTELRARLTAAIHAKTSK